MKGQILFSRKNKKNINLSSAESAHSMVSVKRADGMQTDQSTPFGSLLCSVTTLPSASFREDLFFNCMFFMMVFLFNWLPWQPVSPVNF